MTGSPPLNLGDVTSAPLPGQHRRQAGGALLSYGGQPYWQDTQGNLWALTPAGASAVPWSSAPGATTAPAAVTVSPYGTANGKSGLVNGGAQYGPDTAGTVTCGLQEAISYAVAQALAGTGAYDILLLPGIFPLSAITNATYRAALTVDSGYAISAATPVSIRIRGAAPAANPINGTTYYRNFPLGTSVIDASGLDSLSAGLFKQGRVLIVPPQPGANWPGNSLQLTVEDLVIILPCYSQYGTGGGPYTLGGYGAMSLFVNGDTQTTNVNHFMFVNGIDAWAASDCKVRNVQVLSAIAAYNSTGNLYAGGGGIYAAGSAAAAVMPSGGNQGIIGGEALSAYDVPIALQCGPHTSFNQMNVAQCQLGIYMREGGHGAYFSRLKAQFMASVIQHAILPQLGGSLSGHTAWDPTADLYAPISETFPSSASAGSMVISQAGIESIAISFLVDDPSNPLTVQANVEHAGSIPASRWGSGANLMINMIDITGNAQTVLTGTTAGTATYTQSGATPWDKRFTAYLAGYENTTGTAQAVTFVVPYNNAPAIVKDDTGGATVSATTLTLPASMNSPVTGYIILGGY